MPLLLSLLLLLLLPNPSAPQSPASAVVSTLWGSVQGSADGTGTSATFKTPTGTVFDALTGRIYQNDNGNNKALVSM